MIISTSIVLISVKCIRVNKLKFYNDHLRTLHVPSVPSSVFVSSVRHSNLNDRGRVSRRGSPSTIFLLLIFRAFLRPCPSLPFSAASWRQIVCFWGTSDPCRISRKSYTGIGGVPRGRRASNLLLRTRVKSCVFLILMGQLNPLLLSRTCSAVVVVVVARRARAIINYPEGWTPVYYKY